MPKKKDKGRETLSGHNIVKFKTIKEKKFLLKKQQVTLLALRTNRDLLAISVLPRNLT